MPLNQNILIASNDYIADAVSLTANLFHYSFPASDYKNKKMWKFARFSSKLPSLTYTVEDLGTTRNLQLFACIKHNMGNLARWRIRVADSEAELISSPIYDSGLIYMTAFASGFGTESWGTFDWGAVSGYEDTAGLNRCAYHAPLVDVAGRYVRYDFDDSVDVEARADSYMQFARLWASAAYQPSLNMPYGAEIVVDDSTDETVSKNKVSHFSPLVVKQRRLVAEFNDLPKAELLRYVFGALFMQVGKSEELVVLMAPMEPAFYPYEAMYGNLADTDGAKYTYFNRMSSSLHVKESV